MEFGGGVKLGGRNRAVRAFEIVSGVARIVRSCKCWKIILDKIWHEKAWSVGGCSELRAVAAIWEVNENGEAEWVVKNWNKGVEI